MSPSQPFLNRIVAGYRLTTYIGAGGMGEVFKAVNPETGQFAAVKVLYRPEFAARFRNEASVHASISHPNIATLYDSSLIDNRPALVMEWVDGESMDELIRRKGRLSNTEASRIMEQMVSAITYLHQNGIVHRDLKPSNVRVRPDGQIKLLDFGIAKGLHTPQLTQIGFAVGTTEFMAPEQFNGRVESKSDSWALGVMLYEMTTGHLPFEAASPLLLRQQITRGHFTSPRLLNPDISPVLISVIEHCLQTNPAKRATAVEIGQQLKTAENTETPTERKQPLHLKSFPTSNWLAWLLAILIIIGISVVNGSWKKIPKQEETSVSLPDQYEQILVEVLNADYDLELVMPDGTVQDKEPFRVRRLPGEALPITIRHGGTEQQYIIAPEVRELYQCYFDR
jgi:serine/threonine protein kinase